MIASALNRQRNSAMQMKATFDLVSLGRLSAHLNSDARKSCAWIRPAYFPSHGSDLLQFPVCLQVISELKPPFSRFKVKAVGKWEIVWLHYSRENSSRKICRSLVYRNNRRKLCYGLLECLQFEMCVSLMCSFAGVPGNLHSNFC